MPGVRMPPEGAQRRMTEKTNRPTSAVRKAGLEMPTKAGSERAKSSSLPRLTALTMPAAMPTTMAMSEPRAHQQQGRADALRQQPRDGLVVALQGIAEIACRSPASSRRGTAPGRAGRGRGARAWPPVPSEDIGADGSIYASTGSPGASRSRHEDEHAERHEHDEAGADAAQDVEAHVWTLVSVPEPRRPPRWSRRRSSPIRA